MESKVITQESCAKINHFLHINDRRADGKHQLQTLFQKIALIDLIKIQKSNSTKLTVKTTIPNQTLSSSDNNIITAIQKLQQ